MSEALWVTTPGGYRMATDDLLAVAEWLSVQRARSLDLAEAVGNITRWFPDSTVWAARREAEDLVGWASWLSGVLDEYAEKAAVDERWRIAVWERPREIAVTAWLGYGTGRPGARGSDSLSFGMDDGAAALSRGRDISPQVAQSALVRDLPIATSLASRIARIPPTSEPIRVERYAMPDGGHHVEVYIAGTADFSAGSRGSAFDMAANLALVAGLSATSLRATEMAMTKAGVTKTDRVVFVGHSQGGLVAARLAESGRYTTAGLITVGAPLGTAPLRGDYPAMVIEHRDDPVPSLAGPSEDAQAYRVRTDSGADPGNLVDAHRKSSYQTTASRIDRSPAVQLSRFTDAFPAGLRGVARTFSAGVPSA